MTRREVCEALGISDKTLYTWEKAGRIPRPSRNHRGWRTYAPEDIEAIRRLLGRDARDPEPHAPATRLLAGLSARNQLRGTVREIRVDGVLSEVILELGDGQRIVSVVTSDSVRRLGIRVGEEAVAVIKSTEVMLYR